MKTHKKPTLPQSLHKGGRSSLSIDALSEAKRPVYNKNADASPRKIKKPMLSVVKVRSTLEPWAGS